MTKNENIQVYGEAKLSSSPESGFLVYNPTNTNTQEATTLILTPGTEVDYRFNIINGLSKDVETSQASYMQRGDNIAIKLQKDYIKGVAWHDINKDGIKDDGETILAGIKVERHNANGKIDAVTTDDAGEFHFPAIESGKYKLVFSKAGYVAIKAGNDSVCDSDGIISEVDTSLSSSRFVYCWLRS